MHSEAHNLVDVEPANDPTRSSFKESYCQATISPRPLPAVEASRSKLFKGAKLSGQWRSKNSSDHLWTHESCRCSLDPSEFLSGKRIKRSQNFGAKRHFRHLNQAKLQTSCELMLKAHKTLISSQVMTNRKAVRFTPGPFLRAAASTPNKQPGTMNTVKCARCVAWSRADQARMPLEPQK